MTLSLKKMEENHSKSSGKTKALTGREIGNANLIPLKKGYDPRRNMKGRPQTPVRNLSSALKELLASNHIRVEWKVKGKSKLQFIDLTTQKDFYHHIAAVLIRESLHGSLAAIKEISDRTEGRASPTIDAAIINQTNVTAVMGLRIGDSEELKDTKDVRGALAIIGDNWTATGA